MKMTTIAAWICLVSLLLGNVVVADVVELSLDLQRNQAAGFPIVVNVNVKNIGKDKIRWWCGGPKQYPGGEHFDVSVRYNADRDWREVSPSNGQYVQGSGFTRFLKPGESIVVPLAIPLELPDSGLELSKKNGNLGGVSLRISPKTWDSNGPAEAYVTVWNKREYLDARRQSMIKAIFDETDCFNRHLADQYADEAVVDAMLKLVSIDCGPVALRAAKALGQQPSLPNEMGEELVEVARRWMNPPRGIEFHEIISPISAAALKTRSKLVRKEILHQLETATDSRAKRNIIDALALSKGDLSWLEQARSAIESVQVASSDDKELARRATWAIKWLDSRISNLPKDEH